MQKAQENRAALAEAESMLVKVGAAFPAPVVQKLPLKLLLEWEAVEVVAREVLEDK